MLETVATWLESLDLPTAIRESEWLYPILETVHVLALALVFGSIAMLDLRLLGIARRDQPAWLVARQALPWTWAAFVVAIVSGALLFSSSAVRYLENGAFLFKLLLLVLAGVNVAAFHLGAGRNIKTWALSYTPPGAKLAAGLSLALWVGVIAAGRWIGFVSATPF